MRIALATMTALSLVGSVYATPFVLPKQLPPNHGNRTGFGADTAIDGAWAAVSSRRTGSGADVAPSSVSLFEQDGGSWRETTKLFKPASLTLASRSSVFFGDKIDLDDEWLVVGDYQHSRRDSLLSPELNSAGLVSVYRRTGGSWANAVNLVGSVAGAGLGVDLAVDGGTLVGVRRGRHGCCSAAVAGQAYVYDLGLTDAGAPTGSTIAANAGQPLVINDPDPGPIWSTSNMKAAISGDTIVLAATSWNDYSDGRGGKAFVFERSAAGWTHTASIEDVAEVTLYASFGSDIALDGDTLAIANGSNEYRASDRDSVLIFERNHGGPDNWGLVETVTRREAGAAFCFACGEIDLVGDTLVVGERGDLRHGTAHVFQRDAGGEDNWGKVQFIKQEDVGLTCDTCEGFINEQQFSHSVALDDHGQMLVASPFFNSDQDAVVQLTLGTDGDYNRDGVVDASDYLVLKESFGQTRPGLPADGNNNGMIDAGDFTIWRDNLGRAIGSATSASVATAPEPGAACLAAVLILAGYPHICRSSRR
ncbi:MAG: dockerin type I domain-containing protein [Planctomycetota bacterium]